MDLSEIKSISIKYYLASLGHFPKLDRAYYGMYLSPLRSTDNKASLKVDYNKNIWFDHGTNDGGSIIDLVMKIKNLSFKQAIYYLNNEYKENGSFSFHCNSISNEHKHSYKIISEQEITSIALINYLKSRNLNLDLCKKYCRELIYTVNNKQYFGISFKNNSGGYEIRNRYFKGCLIKKDITILSFQKKKVRVFESWSDFISYLTIYPKEEMISDYLILNSLSLLHKSLEKILSYDSIELFLDRDTAGIEATAKLINVYAEKVFNRSDMYTDFKDVNEYLKHLVL